MFWKKMALSCPVSPIMSVSTCPALGDFSMIIYDHMKRWKGIDI